MCACMCVHAYVGVSDTKRQRELWTDRDRWKVPPLTKEHLGPILKVAIRRL